MPRLTSLTCIIGFALVCQIASAAEKVAASSTSPADEALVQSVLTIARAAAPLETVQITDRPVTITAEAVQTWRGGNRLMTTGTAPRILIPGSYMPGTLRVSREGESTVFSTPDDVIVDDFWGAFGISKTSRLKAGDRVQISYRYSLRRVDSVVRADGALRLIAGVPSPECAALPETPAGTRLVARVYRPFNATEVRPEHIYVVKDEPIDLSPKRAGPGLERVIEKLRRGDDVTVVCWGDSVTVGGADAGPPGSVYVEVFEKRLKERYPKAKLRVINAGIGGTSTLGRLPSFQKEVLDFHPDLVTLEFVNDMGLPRAKLQELYDEILTRVRGSGAELILITPHFTMPSWMPMTGARERDKRPAVKFLREFAAKHNVGLADASLRWEQLERIGIPYEVYLRNGINHPDERGHLIFAEELMRFFAP